MQSTTIIIGNQVGITFNGPGSLRQARSAAKGRKSVVRFIHDGRRSLIAFNPEGFILSMYDA